MHLLAAQRGTIADGAEAVDLGQSPGDILFLSAADTELAALAGAARRRGFGAGELRLANLLRLSHPMSVDTWLTRMGALPSSSSCACSAASAIGRMAARR